MGESREAAERRQQKDTGRKSDRDPPHGNLLIRDLT
jgi:hypothetical protein